MTARPGIVAREPPAISVRDSIRGSRREHPGFARCAVPFIVPLALAAGWEWVVWSGHVPARLMPPPSQLVRHATALIRSGELLAHAAATLLRVAIGVALGTAAGTAIGTLAGTSALARRAFDPSLQALRAIPSVAWVPLFVLWLGILEAPKIVLVALGAFFPVYVGVLAAIQDVDRALLELGRVCGLSRWGLVRQIMLPAILPQWVTATRIGLGLGFMFVLAAELLGASEGLGYLLLDGQQMGRADTILVAMMGFGVLERFHADRM